MGIGGLHIWHLLIILVIVVLIFGTKRLKTIGGDLGGAIKGFKKGMSDEDTSGNGDSKRLENDDDEDAEFPEQKDKSRRA